VWCVGIQPRSETGGVGASEPPPATAQLYSAVHTALHLQPLLTPRAIRRFNVEQGEIVVRRGGGDIWQNMEQRI